MTFTQLEVFTTLAETGNFSRAATLLGITQSAVSHALRALERELGVQLFARERAAAELTPAGARLLIRAHELRAVREALLQEARNARGLQEGLLRVASFGSTSSLRILPELLERFAQRHPGITVTIDEEDDATVARWLEERRVEIGFVGLPDDRFETLLVAQDEYLVLLPGGHPLAKQKAIRPSDLANAPFVLPGGGCGALMESLLDHAGARPRVIYRFPQILSILGFVQRGLALSLSPRLSLPEAHPGVCYRPLRPALPRRVGLAVRAMDKLSPAAAAFMALAQESFGGKGGRGRVGMS